jgi:hypothetical protein
MRSQKHEEMLARLDQEILITKATAITFDRLHKLVKKGYSPDLESDACEAGIRLAHPSKGFRYNQVTLYPDGAVISDDQLCASRDEDREFQEFLRQVPRPTVWERARDFRIEVWAWVIMGVAILAIYGLVRAIGWVIGGFAAS